MSPWSRWSALLLLTIAACSQGTSDDARAQGLDAVRRARAFDPPEPVATAKEDAAPARAPIPPRAARNAVVMAAWAHGLVALDVASSHTLARAQTTFPVEDLVYDPWRDRWVAFEYEDGSENQVTVWKLDLGDGGDAVLELEHVIETGGHCRLAVTRRGLVIFEDDGLQQRWLATDDELREVAWQIPYTSPASVVVREGPTASSLLELSLRYTTSEPYVSLARIDLGASGFTLVNRIEAPDWAALDSPARMAEGADGTLVVAQMIGPWLQTLRLHPAGVAAEPPHDRLMPAASQVEALAVDPSTEVAFVLLSGLEQLVAVPLKMPDSTELVQLPGQAPIGSWSKQARLMAFERGSRKLLLGVGGALMALHFPEQPGHVPVPVGAWRREGFRAPVALAPGD